MMLVQTTAPATEPVTIAEMAAHMRLDAGTYEPAPGTFTAALVSPAAVGNVDNGAHRWLATFVTATGETQAGVASAAVTVVDKGTNGKVLLSGIPLGGSAVTARKLYRTAAGGSTYSLLATLSNNTATTYTDNVADSSLGAGAPTANTTNDPILLAKITEARDDAELITRRVLITQSWRLVLDQFPMPAMNISSANWYGPQWGIGPGPLSVTKPDGKSLYEIYLPLPPLQTVESIKYIDQNGTLQTLDASQYKVDTVSEPGRLTPAYGCTWPATRNEESAVLIDYTCGYGAAAVVPERIKGWIKLRAATLYEFREEVAIMGRQRIDPLPYVDNLLNRYRVFEF